MPRPGPSDPTDRATPPASRPVSISRPGGDTVVVACGTYYERQIVMKSGVRLTRETGSPDCVTIDAEGYSRVIFCSHVDESAAIVGFRIINGKTHYDGAMYVGSGSNLEIRNCIFENDSATVGGGIYLHHSSPGIIDCVFDGNTTDTWGGGIAIEDLEQAVRRMLAKSPDDRPRDMEETARLLSPHCEANRPESPIR